VINSVSYPDGMGSIVALTGWSGATVEGYTYETFGKFQRFGNAVMNTYGFTGREYDEETGLYYYRARYYDPETGRFISKDPIGFAGGDANLYNYVQGDPVNWGDPWGLYKSHWLLRFLVPGQVAFDKALTALENKDYIGAGVYSANMVGEQALTVLTLGEGRAVPQCTTEGYGVVHNTGNSKIVNYLFERGGLLNSNRYIRIGYGRKGGSRVFRVSGQLFEKLTGIAHWDIWRGGPL